MIIEDSKFYLQLQKDAETFAEVAMKILISMQGKETIAVQKDEVDLSTSADIAAETYIIQKIQKKYPNHSISSEERGEMNGTEPYRWIIDPLDEIKEYVRGISEFNCLIGIEETERIIAGVSVCHGTNETYLASKGNGAWLGKKRLSVSKQMNISDAMIGFALPNKQLLQKDRQKDLSILTYLVDHVYRPRGFWDHAKSLGWTARGALDGLILSPHLYKWPDIASGIIVVEEAGGTVTDWNGNPVTEKTSVNGVLASNGILHEQLLGIIQKG